MSNRTLLIELNFPHIRWCLSWEAPKFPTWEPDTSEGCWPQSFWACWQRPRVGKRGLPGAELLQGETADAGTLVARVGVGWYEPWVWVLHPVVSKKHAVLGSAGGSPADKGGFQLWTLAKGWQVLVFHGLGKGTQHKSANGSLVHYAPKLWAAGPALMIFIT